MQKYTKLIILVFLVALSLRMFPVAKFDYPIGFDTPFHYNLAGFIQDTGRLAQQEIVYNRPNLYPPLYHVLLANTSFITGIELFELSKFILPLLASLLTFSAYILLRRYFKPNIAIVSTFLLMVFPTLVQQSYDSPQNIVFFLLPLLFIVLIKKQWGLAGLILASMLLFNLFSSALILLIVFIYSIFEKRLIVFAKSLLVFILCTASWLIFALRMLVGVKITQLGSTLAQSLLMGNSVVLFYSGIAAITLFIYLFYLRKKGSYVKFWIIYLIVCFAGMVLPKFELRAAEFIIMFSVGGIFLIPQILTQFKKIKLLYIILIALIFFTASLLILDYYEAPVFTSFEKQAIDTYLPHMTPIDRLLTSEYGGIGVTTYTPIANVWPGAFLDFTTDQEFAADTLTFYLHPSPDFSSYFINKYGFDTIYLSQNTYYYTHNVKPWALTKHMSKHFMGERIKSCIFFKNCPAGYERSEFYRHI